MTLQNLPEDEREMTLEEKKRLREILGYELSAALPLAYHPEDDPRYEFDEDEMPREIAKLRAEVAYLNAVIEWRNITSASLRAQLAAMTERRDTLLRIVRAYRSELIDYVIENVSEYEVNAMYSTPDDEIKINFIRWFSRRRREARNG